MNVAACRSAALALVIVGFAIAFKRDIGNTVRDDCRRAFMRNRARFAVSDLLCGFL